MTNKGNQNMLAMSECPLWKILGGYFLEMEMWKLEIKLLDPNCQLSQLGCGQWKRHCIWHFRGLSVPRDSSCGACFKKEGVLIRVWWKGRTLMHRAMVGDRDTRQSAQTSWWGLVRKGRRTRASAWGQCSQGLKTLIFF